jgi:hypothetical protein
MTSEIKYYVSFWVKDLQAARKAWKAHLKHPGKAGRSMGKIAEPNSGDHH